MPHKLKVYVDKKYKPVLFTDLADISNSPSQIYKMLDACRKDVFEDNERIIFYTKYNVDSRMLNHIGRALELMDIGGFFVILFCPSNDSITLNDPISIINIKVSDSKPLDTGYYVPDSVCPLPWEHLEIRHNGDIYPCCVNSDIIDNTKKSKISDVMQSSRMQQLRTDFLQGNKPQGCNHCWSLEAQGIQSNRLWHLGRSSKKFLLNYIDDVKVRSLDIKPGNVCNFKCRICNPVNSSLFAEETRKTKSVDIKLNWDEHNNYIWEELEQLLPTIENIDIYGGEPFLVKKLFALLQTAVDKQYSKQIRLHFNSNGSIFPEKLIPLLLQFKYVDLALSIDNTDSKFELERGGYWQEVHKNIINFAKLQSPTFNVYLMPTVNIQNVLYLENIIKLAEQHKLGVTVNFLNNPAWASIDRLTDSARQLVIDKYQHTENTILKSIVNKIMQGPGSNGSDFVKNMIQFDSIRGQNFNNTHPEMAKAMGYVS